MPKKKAAPSTPGTKPSTSKVNTQDAEKPKSDHKPKLTLESSPRNPNTPNQRRKGSIATLLNEETSPPKRRVSARLNPPSSLRMKNDDEPPPNVIKSDDELPVLNKSDDQEQQPILTTSDDSQPVSVSTPPDFVTQAEARKEEGNNFFKFSKFTQAVQSYTAAIDLNGDNPTYLANRAAAYMGLSDYQSALNDMEAVHSSKFFNLGIQPSIKNSIRLIRCLLPLGKFYQARLSLNQLLKDYPDSNEVKKEESRLDALEVRLNSIQRNRRDQTWAMVLLGLVMLEKALDCGPLKFKEWLLWKVEALCGQKKWEDASSLCSDLIRAHPSDPEVLYSRAKLKYCQGDLTATIRHCQEAMRCDPDFANARTLLRQAKNIENLKEEGKKSFNHSDFKTAIKKYLEASLIDPTNENMVMILDGNRAQALLKSGQNQEAIQTCNKILEIDAKHFKALRTRGRAKKALSDLNAALADLESASNLAPSPKEKTDVLNDIKATKILITRAKYVDHYKVLGVSRDATDDEIKKGFRKMSLIHHPDKGGNEEKFKEINESYRILQDPVARRKFDRTSPDNPDGTCYGESSGADDLFSMDDLFRSSWSKNSHSPFGQHSHTHHSHGYQSSSTFFSNSGF